MQTPADQTATAATDRRRATPSARWDRLVAAPWALPSVLGLLAATILWNAWVCDDAFLTFRVADNFLGGHGLRWNVAERVQAYSNPLWLLLFVPAYGLIGNAYATAIIMGLGCTLAAVALLRRVAGGRGLLVYAVLLCTLSKAFVDYATSGLENPLAFLLLALLAPALFRLHARRRLPARTALLLSLLCSLLMVHRLDAALFVIPVHACLLWRRPTGLGLAGILLGLLPLLAWLLFATLYYGFPLPNTAYAKLQNGWTAPALVGQGFTYLCDSLYRDPLTLTTILAALGSAFLWRSATRWVLATGIVLHLVYVVTIGGDFMSGRLLATPFFAAVLLLTTISPAMPAANATAATAAVAAHPSRRRRALAAGLLALGVVNPDGTLWNRPFWRGALSLQAAKALYLTPDQHGICDERAFYYPTCGLMRGWSLPRLPDHPFRHEGERGRALIERSTDDTEHGAPVGMVLENTGFAGFFAGPRVDIVDPGALGDAFLARLPPRRPRQRIGHIARDVPPQYLESRESGTNCFTDPAMHDLYDRITLLTQGPLFEPARLRLIWQLNLP